MLNKKSRFELVLVSILLLSLVMGSSLMAAPKGQITIPLFEGNIGSLDPRMTTHRQDGNIARQLYDGLVYRDPKNNLKPALATEWITIDNDIIEFKLRPGVYFHDGMEVTAEDVKFTFETALDPKLKCPRGGEISAIEAMEVIDKYTLRIHLISPNPVLLQRLADWPVLPKHYIEEYGWNYFWENPVGTGPYKFVEWVIGERLVLEANENYWRGAPEIGRVVFRVLPDPGTRVAELLTGGLDIDPTVRPDDVIILGKSPNLKILTTPILRNIFLYMSDASDPDSPIADVRVRQAIAHAIDVDPIVDELLMGYGFKLNSGGLNPNHEFFVEEVPRWDYNPDKAKKLLAEAGYPDGLETSVVATDAAIPKGKEVIEYVGMQLEKIGINLKINFMAEVTAYESMMAGDKARPMYFQSWGSFGVPDPDNILDYFFDEGYFNYAAPPEMQKLVVMGASTMDRDLRAEVYEKFQWLNYEQVIWIPLYRLTQIIALNKAIDYTPRADEYIYIFEMSWE